MTINIDNAANSTLYRFDGNWDKPERVPFEFGLDVSYLLSLFDECTFLSLGAGGGADVLQALLSKLTLFGEKRSFFLTYPVCHSIQ